MWTTYQATVTPTPEPGTLALAGTGATALLVSYRWRRMRGPPAPAAKGPRSKILRGQIAMKLAQASFPTSQPLPSDLFYRRHKRPSGSGGKLVRGPELRHTNATAHCT